MVFCVSMVHGYDGSASVITRLNIFPLIAFAFIPRCVSPLLHAREDRERAKKSQCMTVEECVTNRNHETLGSSSKGAFQRRTSAGSEQLSICHNASKFVLLSAFSLVKTI